MSRLPVIGITCYPTQGGSGVVASELGLNLARYGFEVHFITSELPIRLHSYDEKVFFHRVEMNSYPLFQYNPYTLALATKMLEVTQRHHLDILHVHYAIPHAASAFLAREMAGAGGPSVITTLHGTDITLVGKEPSFFPITKFMIERSDAVTAVSTFLEQETRRVFHIERDIDVIPNFIDPRQFRPIPDVSREGIASPGEKLILHVSNFRKVKNVPAVIRVFKGIADRIPARLLLLGEGPELQAATGLAGELGIADRIVYLGQKDDLERYMSLSDLLLLPSWHESFGLVALEAMACGTPAIATSIGGAGEFISHQQTSFLHDPGDEAGMIDSALGILTDPELYRQVAEDGLRVAVSQFGAPCVVKQYIELYDRVLGL